jgi:hypothetical protein
LCIPPRNVYTNPEEIREVYVKFSITYQRAIMGNDIEIQIDAEAGEVISAVDYNLDGFGLPGDDLSETPVVSFHRTLSRVGEAGPGRLHKLIVEVRGQPDEASKYASRVWTDLT